MMMTRLMMLHILVLVDKCADATEKFCTQKPLTTLASPSKHHLKGTFRHVHAFQPPDEDLMLVWEC